MEIALSVIVPCFNQGEYLTQCLNSIAHSTTTRHEVIIVNDGSTDRITQELVEVLQAASPHQDLVVIDQENQGLAQSRNIGMRAARGDFIRFLDADDLLLPGISDQQMGDITRTRSTVALCDHMFVNDELTKAQLPLRPTSAITFAEYARLPALWEHQISIPIHAGLFSRHAQGLYFPAELRNKEDWVFWAGIVSLNAPPAICSDVGVAYRQHGQSMSHKHGVDVALQWLSAYRKVESMMDLSNEEKLRLDEHFRRTYLHPEVIPLLMKDVSSARNAKGIIIDAIAPNFAR